MPARTYKDSIDREGIFMLSSRRSVGPNGCSVEPKVSPCCWEKQREVQEVRALASPLSIGFVPAGDPTTLSTREGIESTA